MPKPQDGLPEQRASRLTSAGPLTRSGALEIIINLSRFSLSLSTDTYLQSHLVAAVGNQFMAATTEILHSMHTLTPRQTAVLLQTAAMARRGRRQYDSKRYRFSEAVFADCSVKGR